MNEKISKKVFDLMRYQGMNFEQAVVAVAAHFAISEARVRQAVA